ncbi:hypothetical protein ACROYT_G021547 [Oculina patagonica]
MAITNDTEWPTLYSFQKLHQIITVSCATVQTPAEHDKLTFIPYDSINDNIYSKSRCLTRNHCSLGTKPSRDRIQSKSLTRNYCPSGKKPS